MMQHFNVGPVTVLEIGFVDSISRNSFLPATTQQRCTKLTLMPYLSILQESGLNGDTIVLTHFALVYI